MPLQLVSDDNTPLPPLFAHLRLVEAQPDLEPIYISIPAPAVQVRTDGGYDIYPGSFFPGQVDKIRNHPHPQTPDAIMALETFLIGGVGPTLPGATFTGNVTVNSPAAFIGNGSVPPGGAVGQVLTKTGAGDYAVAWQNASGGGLTLPLTQNLTFSPSATWNIGDNTGGLHPYRIFAESDWCWVIPPRRTCRSSGTPSVPAAPCSSIRSTICTWAQVKRGAGGCSLPATSWRRQTTRTTSVP